MSKIYWRTEPTFVETPADDLWLVVKFQSNSVIAGSPRNSFRTSVRNEFVGGRALNAGWPPLAVLTAIKLRMPINMPGSQTVGDKFHGQKGNSPDRQIRSLSLC